MKYYVTFKIDSLYDAEVEASNIEEAKKLDEQKFMGIDLNETDIIHYEPVFVYDEEGNCLWEYEY